MLHLNFLICQMPPKAVVMIRRYNICKHIITHTCCYCYHPARPMKSEKPGLPGSAIDLFIHLLVASDAPGLRCCMYAVCVLRECSVPHVRSVCPACAYTYRSCVHAAYRTLSGIWDSVPRPGTELWAPALAEWHLSHWVTRDAPQMMGCLSFPFTL